MTEDAPKSVSVGGVGEPREARASFAFLLGTLLLIMLTDPVFGRTRAGAFAMTAAFSAVLLTGVYAVSDSRGHLAGVIRDADRRPEEDRPRAPACSQMRSPRR